MKRFTEAEQLFLSLYRAGLWADIADGKHDLPEGTYRDETWQGVSAIAQSQTCVGVVTDSITRLPREKRPPKTIYFGLVSGTGAIEQENRRMNESLRGMFPMFKRLGFSAWLLKGQGLAQCYPQPLHRTSGDIDVYFPQPGDFDRATSLFAKYLPREDTGGVGECSFSQNGILIELHRDIATDLNGRLHHDFPTWSSEVSTEQPDRWGDVVLPPVRFNVVFVFVHLARHFIGGGIGLRQVADWMRFLYTHRAGNEKGWEAVDAAKLETDLRHLGLWHLWQVFGCMAVDYLGCPREAMPFYDARLHRQAARVLRIILDEGNFGYYDEAMNGRPTDFVKGKIYSFFVQTRRMVRKCAVFPREVLYNFPKMVKDGVKRTMGVKSEE